MWLTITGQFLLVLTTSVVLAQSPRSTTGTPPDPVSETPGKGSAKITGYVVDSTLTKSVEFANIALYTTDNKLIDGR